MPNCHRKIFTQSLANEHLIRDKKVYFRNDIILMIGAVGVAMALKTLLIIQGVVPFNADEAVVALMARHILGGARPVFFYGQAYMGSLDAWLVAGGFYMLGQEVWVIRLVQSLLYLLTLSTTAWLGKEVFGEWRVGVIAAWMLAIPTVNVALYTTVSLGGYGEALMIGNLIIIFGLRIGNSLGRNKEVPAWLWILWGFLVGLGIWTFGITIVYSLPVGIYLTWSLWKHQQSADGSIISVGRYLIKMTILVFFGFLVGSSPWWIYAFRHGLRDLVLELSGAAIAGVEGLHWLSQVIQHLINLFLLGTTVIFGFRPPWGVQWLGLPILPFVLIFWLAVVVYMTRLLSSRKPIPAEVGVLVGIIFFLVLGFVITPFGADPSGRYFLPLIIPLTLFAGKMIWDLRQIYGIWALGLVVLVMIFNFWGTVQSAIRNPPGLTTQFDAVTQIDHREMDELIAFLREHEETRGYSNYWVSYPLAFLSKEEMIFVPRLPYHQDFRYTDRDDRYQPYSDLVADANQVAYITTSHRMLDDHLRMNFTRLGVVWQEIQIGDYNIFYGLSLVITPDDLGLGFLTP